MGNRDTRTGNIFLRWALISLRLLRQKPEILTGLAAKSSESSLKAIFTGGKVAFRRDSEPDFQQKIKAFVSEGFIFNLVLVLLIYEKV